MVRHISLSLYLCVFALAFGASESEADVYMLKDSRGVTYFTDKKPSTKSNFKLVKKYRSFKRTSSRSYSRRALRNMTSAYDGLIEDAAKRYRLDAALVKSVIKVESDFNRFSISSKGARGLMQLMPETAKMMKVKNLFNPRQNIYGGSRYLRRMLDRFGGDLRLALAAYNAGPTSVSTYNGIPPYKETQRYVRKVFKVYNAISGQALSPYRGAYGRHKTVVYRYIGPDGHAILTDMPIGKRVVISD